MIVDIVQIVGNLSQSLVSIQALIAGMGYILGIMFFVSGILKLKSLGDVHENKLVPLMLLGIGAILIFLPSAISTFSATVFGSGNILQYIAYNPYNIYNSIGIMVRTAGLIWFVRGCVLLIHGSEAQGGGRGKEGAKGIVFIFAGILAMNFQETAYIIGYIIGGLTSISGSH